MAILASRRGAVLLNRDSMVRDKFIAAQWNCGLRRAYRRQLPSVGKSFGARMELGC